MEDNHKKTRGLGKGLSELLGEARAKAAISKQPKSETQDIKQDINKTIETSSDYSIKDNDLSAELDNLNNISKIEDDFDLKNHATQNQQSEEQFDANNDVPHDDNKLIDDDDYETITASNFDKEMREVLDFLTPEELDTLSSLQPVTKKQIPFKDKNGVKTQEKNIENNYPDTGNVQNNPSHKINTDVMSPKDMLHEIPIELINPNKEQPRKFFDVNELNDLASSIKIYGVIQPILVKQIGNEYTIIAGERRWRASQIAGLKTIPAIIAHYQDHEIMEVALIENIQRANLTPLDEAKAYHYLMNTYELTQFELSQRVGKSRSYVANMVRLLELDDNVKNYLETGDLSIGHARVLVGVKNAADLAEKIIKSHMSVRKAEEFVSQLSEKQNVRLPKAINTGKNIDILALEADLRAALGVNVSINTQSAQKGNLTIRYESLDQLDEVCRRLCSNWGADVA
jgi:ParB family transcriptional regulator, chromosome partitioning protein